MLSNGMDNFRRARLPGQRPQIGIKDKEIFSKRFDQKLKVYHEQLCFKSGNINTLVILRSIVSRAFFAGMGSGCRYSCCIGESSW